MTTGHDIVGALRRYWWLIVLCGAIALAIGYLLTPQPPYVVDFRATVLIPGDTEDTGSSERPELMVLDDLGPFAGSWAFAEMVASEMSGDVAADEIHGMISGSRYSRIATVDVADEDASLAREVAEAAASVFPDAVNRFLVAPGSDPATVQIIDPPQEPSRDVTGRWLRIGAIGLVIAAGVTLLAILMTPSVEAAPSRPVSQ